MDLLGTTVVSAVSFSKHVIGMITRPYQTCRHIIDHGRWGELFFVGLVCAFINFIMAGFQYMMAAGDAKAIQSAWDRIWYSLLGLILMVGAFALAAVFGYLLFNDPGFMLRPVIYTATS